MSTAASDSHAERRRSKDDGEGPKAVGEDGQPRRRRRRSVTGVKDPDGASPAPSPSQPRRRGSHPKKKPLPSAAILTTLGVDDTALSIDHRYKIGHMLGEGRFSQVMAGTCVQTGVQVALKVMGLDVIEEGENPQELHILALEVAVLRRVQDCDNIVGLREVLCTPESLYLVMEQINGTELFEAIAGSGGLDGSLCRRLLTQLFGALAALHALGCTHRDISPSNVMVSQLEPPTNATLTVIDFGYAASATSGLTGLAGSPEYAAPEVLTWLDDRGLPLDSGGTHYTSACDVRGRESNRAPPDLRGAPRPPTTSGVECGGDGVRDGHGRASVFDARGAWRYTRL